MGGLTGSWHAPASMLGGPKHPLDASKRLPVFISTIPVSVRKDVPVFQSLIFESDEGPEPEPVPILSVFAPLRSNLTAPIP